MTRILARCAVASTLTLAGCGELATVDQIPVGEPKGFVEFYIAQVAGGHSARTVRIVVEEATRARYQLPTTEFAGFSAPRLRVAAVPGTHLYKIMHKKTRGQWPSWQVPVKAGMLTRVAVEVLTTSFSTGLRPTRYLDVKVSIAPPVPHSPP